MAALNTMVLPILCGIKIIFSLFSIVNWPFLSQTDMTIVQIYLFKIVRFCIIYNQNVIKIKRHIICSICMIFSYIFIYMHCILNFSWRVFKWQPDWIWGKNFINWKIKAKILLLYLIKIINFCLFTCFIDISISIKIFIFVVDLAHN